LLITRIGVLREAIAWVRANAHFRIDAWVVLPDHMHCLWTCRRATPISQVGGAQSKSLS
jgi:REP element-mobilizing transposase RayT